MAETTNTTINVNMGPAVATNKAVNKIAYALLAFFLGGIGVHKFYAGFVGKGMAYLLLCWTGIPGIIAFCTFIKALITQDDGQGNIYLDATSRIVS